MATKKSAVKDLTNGSPVKLILGFALPLLLGMLFQQFYSMVDTIIVGKFLGAKALAAVGSTGSINFMIVGFCMGVCNGFAIPVAQMFGAGDRKALCRYVGNGAVLAGILSVVMTVLVCIWCRDILILMKTPSDILDGAYAYIFVIFLGIPLMVLYNQTSAIMRSLGDSRSPLIFLGISSILNIVLDCAGPPDGSSGNRVGDDYRAGSLWIPVSLLYEEKIHHPCFYERGLEAAQALCA